MGLGKVQEINEDDELNVNALGSWTITVIKHQDRIPMLLLVNRETMFNLCGVPHLTIITLTKHHTYFTITNQGGTYTKD